MHRAINAGNCVGFCMCLASLAWPTGHPHSVDTLLKIDEDTLLTGSSDGIIR